jgi:hypothetical protein
VYLKRILYFISWLCRWQNGLWRRHTYNKSNKIDIYGSFIRFTVSDFPFVIFRLFVHINIIMDTNDTERECNEPQYTLRRHIEQYSRKIIHAIINCNIRLLNMTFPEWIHSHYHDIYHLCYNRKRCNQTP